MHLRLAITALMIMMAACDSQTILTPPASPTTSAQSEDVKSETFTVPRNGRDTAEISLGPTFETVLISPLLESDNLLEADIEYLGQINFDDSGPISLSETNVTESYKGEKPLRWLLRLNPDVSLGLTLQLDSGEIAMDGSHLSLSTLGLSIGSGNAEIDLPANVRLMHTFLRSGALTLNLPQNATINLDEVEVQSGRLDMLISPDSNVNISDLSIGSGSVHVDAPDGAAVRLEVRDVGSGSINLAYPLTRLQGTASDEGIWETGGFATVGKQISIVVKAIGSGSFELE